MKIQYKAIVEITLEAEIPKEDLKTTAVDQIGVEMTKGLIEELPNEDHPEGTMRSVVTSYTVLVDGKEVK